jgi:PAS domain S-box-containing protein
VKNWQTSTFRFALGLSTLLGALLIARTLWPGLEPAFILAASAVAGASIVRLWRRQDRLRVTLSSIGDAVIATDREGRITSMNSIAQALTGWKEVEARRLPLEAVFPIIDEQTRQPVESPIAKVFLEGGVVGLPDHTILITRNGQEKPIEDSAAPIRDERGHDLGVVVVFRDISDRKQADIELKARALQQATVAELGQQALGSLDLDRLLEQAVELVAKTLGVEFVKVLELLPGHQSLVLRAGVGWREGSIGEATEPAGADSPGGFTLTRREPLIVKDLRSETRFQAPELLRGHGVVSGVSVIIHGEAGPWGVLGAYCPFRRDFTEDDVHFLQAVANVLAAAIQRRRAEERIEAASRAKDQFLAILSHELRTPLTPVLMATSELEAQTGLPEELRKYSGLIRRNVELEARLIDDLLDLTRISRGKLKVEFGEVDPHVLLAHVCEICHGEFLAKKLEVTVDLGAARRRLRADAARLEQVFWNLIRNAIKFTPERGRVVIRSSNHDDQFLLQVADSGIGIDARDLTRIFGAFEQGDRSIARRFGGLGLGLSISKALIDSHGGRLTASSPGRGKGSTFTVELPLADGVEIPGRPVAAPAAVEESPPLRILLVEDHEDTARTMARLLAKLNYQVKTAGTLESAHRIAISEPFDLLISDLGLPDGSGLQLMEWLRRRRPIKAIALSGYGMESDVIRSKEAGFLEHVTKPVDFQKLVHLIRQLSSQGAEQPSA